MKSILIGSWQAALLIVDVLLLDGFETMFCPLRLQKPQQSCTQRTATPLQK